MSVAIAVLAAAAVLAWPLRRSAALAWPQPAGSAAPFPGPRVRGSILGSVSRRRRTSQDAADLLAVVEAVLPALEAGLTPGAALALAADVAPAGSRPRPTPLLVSRLARLSAQGVPIGPAWAEAAGAAEGPELRLLAQAWSLTEDLGAPLAEAMRTTAGLLRARVRAERRTAGAVAGARATMNVLTALPFGGPLVAVALGVGPRELYAGSAVTAVCLVAGGLLVLGGRWWVARMVRAVARGPVLS
jgi:tight adherence protein B